MLFNSFAFIFFFLLVVPTYYWLPYRYRALWLLAASCYFYMALIPVYILFLFLLIAIDFTAGIWIERLENPQRRWVLMVSIAANLLLLGTFKYYNFFGNLAEPLAHWLGCSRALPHLSLVLPLGLSFHTFQSMAYTVDVYRKRVPAEHQLRFYALYVMFFPQLVAGPIERPAHLLPQLHQEKTFDPKLAVDGFRLMLWGYFKKMVIADHLARRVDPTYNHPVQSTTGALVVATYFFAFQIYCDFSGYTDIALGTARVLGIRLVQNFNEPYQADSIVDFWRRWHISLSTWFRDYVYFPLGGSYGSTARTIFNLLVVFLLSGLWHGANMTFVAWGFYNGVLVILYHVSKPWREAMWEWCCRNHLALAWHSFCIFLTFNLVCIGWVFFRAASLTEAFYILGRVASLSHVVEASSYRFPQGQFMSFAGLAIILTAYEILSNRSKIQKFWLRAPIVTRWVCYYALMILIVAYGNWGERQFIYFQF